MRAFKSTVATSGQYNTHNCIPPHECMNCTHADVKHPPQGIRPHRWEAVGGPGVSGSAPAHTCQQRGGWPPSALGIANERLFSQLTAPKCSGLVLWGLIQLFFSLPQSLKLLSPSRMAGFWWNCGLLTWDSRHPWEYSAFCPGRSRVWCSRSTLLSLVSSLAKTCLRRTSGMFPRPRLWHLPQLRTWHQMTSHGFQWLPTLCRKQKKKRNRSA